MAKPIFWVAFRCFCFLCLALFCFVCNRKSTLAMLLILSPGEVQFNRLQKFLIRGKFWKFRFNRFWLSASQKSVYIC